MVPGPPKRFAQTIGAVTTTLGAILALPLGIDTAGYVVFAIMAIFATLESVFAFCVGCQIFALLMRAGIIPDEVCEACADISLRRA
jgi:amino acid permease